MGLDTTHDAWHASYTSFFTWRCNIWKAAGLPVIRDTQNERDIPSCWADSEAITDYYGNWTAEPDEPLEYVVNHSDCDGLIAPEHLALLIPRLEGLLPAIEELDDDGFDTYGRTVQFIEGARKALDAGEALEFH